MTGNDQLISVPAERDFPVFDFHRVLREVMGLTPAPLPDFDAPTLTPIKVPLKDAVVGLLVSCGAYYPDQQRLRQNSDLSYRLLPRDRDLTEVLIAHQTPIRAFALADPNVAYPRDTMLDLEREGVFARYADNAVSMVGSISQFESLATETAPRIVDEFTAMGVDLVLTVPYCPQCHTSFAVLARAIEKRGIPTASITTLHDYASALKPPRTSFLDFPLGCTAGRPGEPEQQRDIVRAALQAAERAGTSWELNRLPFQWSPDGDRRWESLVADIYRIDNEIRGTVATNKKAHQGELGDEDAREFTIRCAC
jgi:D-proline reductase (dithiol) PrdB